MDSQAIHLRHNHQGFVNRFIAACQADERVVAAFLGGSYAKGRAGAYSDLDLSLITTDAAYDDFVATREAFLRGLGDLVFLENFGRANLVFFIYSDDTEGELWFASETHLEHLHPGPYHVLLDKTGILAGALFPEPEVDRAEQSETLRQQIAWFWHDLSHFITAMRRGQLWWAHGQIEILRSYCVNLARLRQNFLDPEVDSDPYYKLGDVLPAEQLAPLAATYCALERGAMLQAGRALVRHYQELAPQLAQTHGIPYPAGLERVMMARLEQLRDAG
jgi:predicted nucleotidyltransferase